MTQNTLERLNRNVSKLQEEIKVLRSFVIGFLAKDKEGEYRPEFIKKVIREAGEDAPFTFENKKSFLKEISGKN